MNLILLNAGTLPATEIDVNITFPEGLVLYDERTRFPVTPKAPTPPPLKAQSPAYPFATAVPMDIRSLAPLGMSRPTTIFPKDLRVHFGLDVLKHHHQVAIHAFLVSFSTTKDIRSFGADYTITANEPIDPIEGSISFEVELSKEI